MDAGFGGGGRVGRSTGGWWWLEGGLSRGCRGEMRGGRGRVIRQRKEYSSNLGVRLPLNMVKLRGV